MSVSCHVPSRRGRVVGCAYLEFNDDEVRRMKAASRRLATASDFRAAADQLRFRWGHRKAYFIESLALGFGMTSFAAYADACYMSASEVSTTLCDTPSHRFALPRATGWPVTRDTPAPPSTPSRKRQHES